MKKYGWITLLFISLAIGGIVYFYNFNSKQNSDYSAERSSFNNTSNSTNISDNSTSNSAFNNTSTTTPRTTTETEIASFSTKIKNKKDTNRQGNITITCSALNNTIVKARQNIFFL